MGRLRCALPYVEVSGTSYQMGYQHGEQCRTLIRHMVYEGLPREVARFRAPDASAMRHQALEYEPFIRRFAPHLVDEIRGIADGAEISYEEALMLQCRSELVYWARERCAEPGCTSMAVTRERSATGEVLVGQNLDLGGALEEGAIILSLNPDRHPKEQRPRIVTWTLAGAVGQIGINSFGLARCGNVLISPGWTVGLPTTILFRCILEQRSAEDAIAFISAVPRAKSNNFVLGDSSGRVVDVEATVDDIRVLEPQDGVILHANHYQHPEFVPYDRYYAPEDSRQRLDRLTSLVSRAPRKLSPERLMEFFRDHDGAPSSICKHGHGASAKTVVSAVFRPESGIADICPGNPCEGEYLTLRL